MKLSYKFSFFISSNFEYVIVDALVNVDNGLGHKLLRYIHGVAENERKIFGFSYS